ncbi:unannotated protein [freshwater metagenome]|uniref:Unannotated protein n=1 Tax=freshwater metagenome TaxID=449393 RepID=A0A6J7U3B0_9ZZZZ
MPPIKLPNGSKTVTEMLVGTRFKGVIGAAFARRGVASSDSEC